MAVATIAGQDLPQQFQYDDFFPTLRYTTTETAQTHVYQEGCVPFRYGGETVNFKCEGVCQAEKCQFSDIYNRVAPYDTLPLTFIGYNGEEWTVRMVALSSKQIGLNLFTVSGELLIVSVTSDGCS